MDRWLNKKRSISSSSDKSTSYSSSLTSTAGAGKYLQVESVENTEDLGQINATEGATKRVKMQMLRGLPLPSRWSVHASSLLEYFSGNYQPSSKIAGFDFDNCVAATSLTDHRFDHYSILTRP